MFKINLIPEVQEKKKRLKKINVYSTVFGVVVIALCLLAMILISGLQFAKRSELNSTEAKIGEVQKEIDTYKELEKTVLSLEQGLNSARQIIDGTNRWTKLLYHMEKATPSDVQYTSLKLTADQVDAELNGKSVNSIARLVDSYKIYKVIVISGNASPGDKISVNMGGSSEDVFVKSDGSWVFPINIDLNTDQEITINLGQDKIEKIKYLTNDRKLESTSDVIKAEAKNLFTKIEATEYQKKDNIVEFKVKFSFEKGAIW